MVPFRRNICTLSLSLSLSLSLEDIFDFLRGGLVESRMHALASSLAGPFYCQIQYIERVYIEVCLGALLHYYCVL